MQERRYLTLLLFVTLVASACAGPTTAVSTPTTPVVAADTVVPSPTSLPATDTPTPAPATAPNAPDVDPERSQVWYRPLGQDEREISALISADTGDRVWTRERGQALLMWPSLWVRLYDETNLHVKEVSPTGVRLSVGASTLLAGGVHAYDRFLTVTTKYAEIKLTGTTAMIAYHPESELSLLRVFAGQVEVHNLVGVGRQELVDAREWALVAPNEPPQVSANLEDMRELARDLGLWDVFHQVELDVAQGFGPAGSHVPEAQVEIVFVGEPPPTVTSTPPPTATPVPCVIRPPANWQQYSVLRGDTLYSLSRRHGTSVQMIKQVNCLPGDAIQAGQLLWLPYRPPTPTPCVSRPPTGWVQYVVRQGDTLTSLARLRHTSVPQIRLVNCLASDILYVGQVLWLPYQEPTVTPCVPPPCYSQHIVREGETLQRIAARYGTTVQEIMVANCLASSTLRAGQELWIPYECSEPVLTYIRLMSEETHIPADYESHTQITAHLYDQTRQPFLDPVDVIFTTSAGYLGESSSIVRRSSDGVARATLYASIQAGEAQVEARVGEVDDQIIIVFEPGSPYDLTLSAIPDQVAVGDTSTIRATVTDFNGNPVADGTQVSMQTNLGSLENDTPTTVDGVAETLLTSTEPGTADVTAISGYASGATYVTFNPSVAITQIRPASVCPWGVDISFTITGSGFTRQMTAVLSNGSGQVDMRNVTWTDSSTLTATAAFSDTEIYSLTVTTSAGRSATLPDALTVTTVGCDR